MSDEVSADALVEQFIAASLDATEAARAEKEAKEVKDALAVRLLPFIEEVADDGKSYEVLRGGKVMGKLNIQPSTSYVLAEGIEYVDLVNQGLMVKKEGKFIRWYAAKAKTPKADKLKDEEV
jgi:hypothetical protein